MRQVFNKKLHTNRQLYQFIKDHKRSADYKEMQLVDKGFSERIMLVVTEVNGCELCSYAHSNAAFKNGIPAEEIRAMLSGSIDNAPQDESIALLFAQHYADTSGQPTEASWDRLVDVYGKEKALCILGHTRNIMIGNTVGIAVGALKDRFKGKAVEKSSLAYELGIILSVIPFLAASSLSTLGKKSSNTPLIQFS